MLVVILVHRDGSAGWWGANGWRANSADRQIYPRRKQAVTDIAREIEDIATEADETAARPMPAGASSTRPNKSVVVAVRLAPEDAAAVEVLAEQAGLPVSTLLRTWITAGLTASRPESLASAVERLSADVALIRRFVA